MSDFGPIASGSIDLRPLNIFVGPNNSGKTHLATLLYALSKSFRGFPKYPGPWSLPSPPFDSEEPDSPSEEEWIRLARSLATGGRTVRLNDFPRIFRTHAESNLEQVVTGQGGLQFKIGHCFDLNSLSDLVRWTETESHASISVSVNDGIQDLWSFRMEIESKGNLNSNRFISEDLVRQSSQPFPPVNSQFQIENLELILPSGGDFHDNLFPKLLSSVPFSGNRELVDETYSKAMDILKYNSVPRDTYFVPAARSGIMQSLEILTSSVLAHLHATRPGLEWFPTPPTLYGMIAVFLMDMMDVLRRGESPSRDGNLFNQLAEELEQVILGGSIRPPIGSLGGSGGRYSRLVYVPNDSDRQLRFSRSPSTVSELAPLVLYLRYIVSPHDTLIIEEPEDHLHPDAQTKMAIILARLARTGVRVIVTTHSDWLLKQVGNLIRQAELEAVSGSTGDEGLHSGSLPEKDVGVWLFEKDGSTGGSTIREIPYDRSDGVEPTEFADVDEELYNRSADLQDSLEHEEQADSL